MKYSQKAKEKNWKSFQLPCVWESLEAQEIALQLTRMFYNAGVEIEIDVVAQDDQNDECPCFRIEALSWALSKKAIEKNTMLAFMFYSLQISGIAETKDTSLSFSLMAAK